MNKSQKGFTLVELMVTLAILTILISAAVPTFSEMLATNRITGAVEKTKADMEWARTVAIRDNRDVVMTISATGAGNWCYGFDDNASMPESACDCTLTTTANAACTIEGLNKQNDQALYGGTTLSSSQATLTFTSRGLLAGAASTFNFTLAGKNATISVSPLGRSVACSSTIFQFPNC